MSSYHTLVVVRKSMLEIPYDKRHKVLNDLRRLIASHGLRHVDGGHREAAKAISKNALVDRVVVTLVVETHDSIFRRGKKS